MCVFGSNKQGLHGYTSGADIQLRPLGRGPKCLSTHLQFLAYLASPWTASIILSHLLLQVLACSVLLLPGSLMFPIPARRSCPSIVGHRGRLCCCFPAERALLCGCSSGQQRHNSSAAGLCPCGSFRCHALMHPPLQLVAGPCSNDFLVLWEPNVHG